MNEQKHPPLNCAWWTPSDETRHPQDREFLESLLQAGFQAFASEFGLIGVLHGERTVDVIYRGHGESGKRWRLGFIEGKNEIGSRVVPRLPSHVHAAIAWLNNESIENVMEIIDGQENS